MIGRRDFVKAAALSGAGAVLTSTGCSVEGPASSGAMTLGGSVVPTELDEIGIADLQASMEQGERTSREITELYLARIEAIDGRGPELRSVIEVNPDAFEIAERLDEERRSGRVRGPLHGIPILLKDNIDTNDRTLTTAGSLALADSRPTRDAFIAARLRDAGAVLLGKANLSEWANFRGEPSVSGWSARGGQCRNPYALDRSPCGSSSGSGVAVAANLVAAAVGTETNGSIVCPSSICGVVGIKPTVGLWSRSGIIPISHSQDTAGPIARTVRDAAILLGAATGVDAADTATAPSEGNAHTDYTQFLDAAGLRGARIGVARNYPGFSRQVVALLDDAVAAMRDAGAVVIDPVELALMPGDAGAAALLVLEYEFKDGMARYLASLGAASPMKTLADLVAFNRENAETELAPFGQEIFERAVERGPLTDAAYREALGRVQRLARQDGIDALITRHQLHAIAAPTMGPSWVIDTVLGDRFDGGYSASEAAIAGYPSITVPMGSVSGLPVGLSFFGSAWSEPTLLGAAYAYEQTTLHRRPPEFKATV